MRRNIWENEKGIRSKYLGSLGFTCFCLLRETNKTYFLAEYFLRSNIYLNSTYIRKTCMLRYNN